MANNKEILAHLVALGDSPDAVADTLRSLGIKGDRSDCASCPIANYLSSKIASMDFSVWIRRSFYGDEFCMEVAVMCSPGGVEVIVFPTKDCPEVSAIIDFIYSFDHVRGTSHYDFLCNDS